MGKCRTQLASLGLMKGHNPLSQGQRGKITILKWLILGSIKISGKAIDRLQLNLAGCYKKNSNFKFNDQKKAVHGTEVK